MLERPLERLDGAPRTGSSDERLAEVPPGLASPSIVVMLLEDWDRLVRELGRLLSASSQDS